MSIITYTSASIPDRPQTAMLVHDGRRVAYERHGGGEPVLALHATGGARMQWRALAAELGRHFAVVAPDLPGWGASTPGGADRPPRLSDHVAAAEAVLAHAMAGHPSQPVHVVGHSMGGAVALAFAQAFRPRIASLTLIEPSAFSLLRDAGPATRPAWDEIRALAEHIESALRRGLRAEAMMRFVDYWNGPGAYARLAPEAKARLLARAGQVVRDFHALFQATFPHVALRALDLPTFVIRGTDSPAPSRRVCALLADLLPRVTTVVVEGGGHMLPQTHPRRITAEIGGHLRWSRAAWHRLGRAA